MDNMVTVAPYVGAKYRLAFILSTMMIYMKANRYVDLFAGAGNMFIQKPKHVIEVYNDLDKDMCCLFRQLSREETRNALVYRMLDLPYNQDMYVQSKASTKVGLNKSGLNETEYAARLWFLLLTSMNGSKVSKLKNVNFSLDEIQFRNMIFHKLEMLERFEGVQVINRNALDIIREETENKALSSNTMYFMDSPYYENKAGYVCDMASSNEHIEYCELVGKLGGYKMVCGYDNPVYQEILVEQYGFHKYFVKEVAKNMQICIGDSTKDREEEYVWLSYKLKGAYEL